MVRYTIAISIAAPRSRWITRRAATVTANNVGIISFFTSVFSLIEPASISIMATFTNSDGWNIMPAMLIQFTAPPYSLPIKSSAKSMPTLAMAAGILRYSITTGFFISTSIMSIATMPMQENTS